MQEKISVPEMRQPHLSPSHSKASIDSKHKKKGSKVKSIEGSKVGKVIAPGLSAKRYEITVQPEDYQTASNNHKHSTQMPKLEKIMSR